MSSLHGATIDSTLSILCASGMLLILCRTHRHRRCAFLLLREKLLPFLTQAVPVCCREVFNNWWRDEYVALGEKKPKTNAIVR